MDNQPANEWTTRKQLIDPKLTAAGWRVVPYSPQSALDSYDRCAITEFPTNHGPADYALVANGEILGIVEAKKLTLGPQNVLTQAERYSKGASINPRNYRGYHVPFLYSTNGEVIWHQDIRHPLSRSRRINQFHTPKALKEYLGNHFERHCERLLKTPNDHPRLRPYQREANAAVEQAIANRKRQMLVAMCTGCGKTFVTVNQVYRLLKAGVAKRILFLVDRRALAAQAVRAFASFEPEPNLKFNQIYEVYSQRFRRDEFDDDEPFDPQVLPSSYLLDPQSQHAFVYVCTIQRMTINLFGRGNMLRGADDEGDDDDAGQLDIPIHAFDLIVADECHRGYTASEEALWRSTLDHFDAIKIGLTATPAAHTVSYFKDIVYRYDYERAVREGYLVDYDLVAVKSEVRLKGMLIGEGQRVGVVDPASGAQRYETMEDEIPIDTSEVEQKATSPDSNRRILEEIQKYAVEHEERWGRFPKTLIFAANDLPHTSHADALVDLARDVFGRGDSFVQKITGTVDRPLQRIREFRNRPNPGIAVTVDLLSTGVDIPDLEYIVFLRPVRSRILFEQMLGRGTRKGVLYPDKSHFVVFDCFDGSLVEQFKRITGITAEPPQTSTRAIEEIIEDIWQNRDRDYNIRCLVKRLQRIDKEMSGEARDLFAAFIPDGDMGHFASSLGRQLKQDFTATMKILRDPAFLALLTNFPRRPRTFIVAYEVQDTVSSTRSIGEAKPGDYLQSFARFVREKAAHVEAIAILLERPRDWSPAALVELEIKLKAAPERFDLAKLQQAHELTYHKALIEIISMVKHAAREEEPLYTAEERVARAFANVTANRPFSSEQQKWLDRIRQHLTTNLTISAEDFDVVPVFTRAGTWEKADRIFGGTLSALIQQFNEAMAA